MIDMNKKLTSLFFASFFMVLKVSGASPITLEHTFDGDYYPRNFPTCGHVDDDRYFSSSRYIAKDGNISIKTYNEDYTIRDNYNVHISVPYSYEVYRIDFTPTMKLADGTPFFVVIFKSTTIDYGKSNYTICYLYNARTGAIICDLGSSTGIIDSSSYVYNINNKPSLCVIYGDVTRIPNSYESITSFKTKIYSLGSPPSGDAKNIEYNNNVSEPIRTYNLNGVLINEPVPGSPCIIVNSDGTSNVVIK